MSDRNCPSCGLGSFYPCQMNLLRCSGCSLVVDGAVWWNSVNEMFEEEWFGTDYDPESSFWVKRFENWNNKRTFRRLASAYLPGRRLLEVGVGSGSFLGYMRDRGFDVMGCDLSKSLCKRVTDKFHIPMHHGEVRDIPPDSQFDVIVMNHVLEHMANPIDVLTSIKHRLTSKGLLHVAVPNINCWEARLSGWANYEPYHLLYFTPESLRSAVHRAGFVIEHQSTRESFSGWFLALLRTAYGIGNHRPEERYSKRKARAQSWIEHVYRTGMVASGFLTLPLRTIQGWLGKGDEIVALARLENGC